MLRRHSYIALAISHLKIHQLLSCVFIEKILLADRRFLVLVLLFPSSEHPGLRFSALFGLNPLQLLLKNQKDSLKVISKSGRGLLCQRCMNLKAINERYKLDTLKTSRWSSEMRALCVWIPIIHAKKIKAFQDSYS